MNPIEKKRKQAVGRKRAFVDAIASETYGKCPRPPCGGGSLKNMIDSFVSVRAGSVLVRCLDQWNKAEIEYALKVCKALGFKATWV